MDNSGQLTFSDDPMLNGANEVYQLIEEGQFVSAVDRLDDLMDIDPDYPGLIEAYRTAKFWENRAEELKRMQNGRETADFLMKEWSAFEEYAETKSIKDSAAYRAVMKQIFFRAADHYKIAFTEQQDTINNFNLLLNLGDCFLRLEEYKNTIETLEFARSSYTSNARLLAILGEAYFHTGDIPKSLLYFREAFLIEPSDIDLDQIRAKPILDLVRLIRDESNDYSNLKEWIPIYGFLNDTFYVRRNLSKRQVESIENDIYDLEVSYQKMGKEQLETTNILPRLINKYLWMMDYYEFQNYNFENITQIRDRLITIKRDLFEEYFNNQKSR